MKSNDFEEYEENQNSGFTEFQPTPENISREQLEAKLREEGRVQNKEYMKQTMREQRIRIFSWRRFAKILKPLNFSYDPSLADSTLADKPYLYKSRAEYLLKHRFLQTTLGPYRIEYSVLNNFCYSHYSLNYGIKFQLLKEFELMGSYSDYIETVSNMVVSTEDFLRNSMREAEPPYLIQKKIKRS